MEMHRHLDTVLSFLKTERPDIICLQEVLERDFSRFERELEMKGRFEPMALLASPRFESEVRGLPFGLAILSRYPTEYRTDYYFGAPGKLPLCIKGDEDNRILLSATVLVNGQAFRVGTTHFTWTPDGNASEAQRADIVHLLAVLDAFPDIIFCGDFNAPRGREIWKKIAARYKDNIPPDYTSSVDPLLHRAKDIEVMVDGLFSTPEYLISDVRLVEGVSDHKAIVGLIERIK